MKIIYDKKGLVIIGVIFLLSVIINARVQNMDMGGVIAFTIGVFSPYIIFLIGYLLYCLIRFKEIRFFTDWRVVFFLIGLEALSVVGSHGIGDSKKNLSGTDITELNESETFDITFKEFLKKKNIDMDIDKPNVYETVQPDNKYSNHYFNVATDFPDNWEHDRGVSNYALFRTFQIDSSLTLSLIAVPAKVKKPKADELHREFQASPIKTMNENFGGDYKSYMLKQIGLVTTSKVYDFEFSERKFGSTNYLIITYKTNETIEDVEIPFINMQHQTNLWGVSYTFGYTAPLPFYDPDLMQTVMQRTTYINPKL